MQNAYTYNINDSLKPNAGYEGYAVLDSKEIDFNRETEYIHRDSDEW